jgi:hypothetical protein
VLDLAWRRMDRSIGVWVFAGLGNQTLKHFSVILWDKPAILEDHFRLESEYTIVPTNVNFESSMRCKYTPVLLSTEPKAYLSQDMHLSFSSNYNQSSSGTPHSRYV